MARLGNLLTIVFTLLLASTHAWGQSKQVNALVAAANQRTKQAKTIAQYQEILQLCARIEGARPDKANAAYATKLQAWAHNRIGEAYVRQASQLTKPEEKKKAAQIDKQALGHFETAVKKDPSHWKARHNRGVSYGLLHRYEDAVGDFSAAIKSKPSYVNSWFNRAEIYYELGKYERAVADYTHVLSKSPKDLAALVQRGHSLFRLNRTRQAIRDYEAAIGQDARRADLYVFRGDSYQALGSWGKASLDYRKAIQLDEKNAHAFRSSAWLMATCPDEQFRRPDRAIDAGLRAFKLYGSKGGYRTLDALAAAYANAGEFSKADETIAKAIDNAPRKMLDSLVRRQRLYRAKKPFRQGTRVAARDRSGQ